MNNELWNLMPMDSIQNIKKKIPVWGDYFDRIANNQFITYEFIYENTALFKICQQCYKDNLHSIWAVQELYRKGNSLDEFY